VEGFERAMDWTRAIEINRAALTRIVATLVALLAAQGGAARLPLPVYQVIARVLLPAESALRRLIVVAARGLVVRVPPVRPMPEGLVIVKTRDGPGRMAFRLFDARKSFGDPDAVPPPSILPRIRAIDDPDPRAPWVLAQLAAQRAADAQLAGAVETSRLTTRLMALTSALESLPRQAKRLVRWRARRAVQKAPTFLQPMRPGPPPGGRKRSTDEIDFVLTECHGLAWDALALDTS
jgi:hypothetical protein